MESYTHGKLFWLALAHFVTGFGLATFVDEITRHNWVPASINALFTALIGSELGLLGLGLAAAVAQPTNRARSVLAIGAATLWLWVLTFYALDAAEPTPPAFILLLAPAVSIASCAFGFSLWAWGVRLIRIANSSGDVTEVLQFTIRHLFGLTGLVAALLAIGRGVRAVVTRDRGAFIFEGAVVLVVAVVAAVIVLTTLWSALGTDHPKRRLPVTLAVAAASGVVPAFYFDVSPLAYLILPADAVLLSFITAASLLVVRHCGYRLVRKPPTDVAEIVLPRAECDR